MDRFVIKGATVITMEGPDHVYPNGVVVVEGDRIKFAGAANEAPNTAGYRTIEAPGRIVMPGLINTHAHVAMTLLRSYADDYRLMDWLQNHVWPAENRVMMPSTDAVYWGTALGSYEMLSGGITTFLDMYFVADQVAKAIQDTGIRGIVTRGIIGVGGPTAAQERLDETREAFHAWNGKADGRISFMVGPHAPYTCPPDTLVACKELADELDLPIHIHLSETYGEVEAALEQWEKTPIRHIHDLGLTKRRILAAHCVHASDEDMDIMAEYGIGVGHCPVSNLKLASGITPVQTMRRLGINVGIGTDGAASDNLMHHFGSEMRIAALLAKNLEGDPEAFKAYDALEMATIEGARALGMDEEIGSLEPGKKADLIIINTRKPHLTPFHDPFGLVAYSVLPSDVEATYVNGVEVYRNGGLTLADGDEIMRKAAEWAVKLAGK